MFEDTKVVIRSHISNKNRQYNGQTRTDNTMAKRKMTKGQTMVYKTLHKKLMIEQHDIHKRQRVNSGAP